MVAELKSDFLVAYDYGGGGLWGLLLARSKAEIQEKYPELEIVDERPEWLTDDQLETIRTRDSYDIDEPPRGLLQMIMADREARS